eukprot:snap_masked-scaffold_16-processed-gene-5.26-mRNA-1 protein AED:1.00 eAED:1.00 QI:0/-1/0/0/-1/1/1/0/64
MLKVFFLFTGSSYANEEEVITVYGNLILLNGHIFIYGNKAEPNTTTLFTQAEYVAKVLQLKTCA